MSIKRNLFEIYKYLKQHLLHLAVVLCSIISISVVILNIGIVFRDIVDKGIIHGDISALNYLASKLSFLFVCFAFFSFLRSFYINLIATKIVLSLKFETYNNLLNCSVDIFENLKLGDTISRLDKDVEHVGNIVVNFLSFVLRNSIMLIGGVILMMGQNFKLAILVIVTIPILLMPLLFLSKKVRALSKKVKEGEAVISSMIEQTILGVRVIYSFNQQSHLIDNFQKELKGQLLLSKKRFFLRSLFFALAISAISLAITTIIWIGSSDIVMEHITSGSMVAFIYYAMIVGMSASGIAELFSELHGPMASADRVFKLRDLSSRVVGNSNVKKINQLHGNIEQNASFQLEVKTIEIKNLSFFYPSRPEIKILRNISLQLSQGEFVGVVGPSGGGKSTLFQLILKFYDYQSGEIIINDINLRSISEFEIRKHIAYVEQEPKIFSGTIRDNIIFSNPLADERKISEVIEICGINEFAKNLPHYIDSKIGERGLQISGGQKQRINIARALLYDAKILFLDEATSALDSDAEKVIMDNIRKIKDITIISIAHRLSSIKDADRILLINNGIVEHEGQHDQLLVSSALYKDIYNQQVKNITSNENH